MIPLPSEGRFVGRVWRAGIGPALVTLRDGRLFDITSKDAPTMRDLLEREDIVGFIDAIPGEDIGSLDEIAAASREASGDTTRLSRPATCRR
jgi:fumarylacetoacetate (FAA) hydrolase family protein